MEVAGGPAASIVVIGQVDAPIGRVPYDANQARRPQDWCSRCAVAGLILSPTGGSFAATEDEEIALNLANLLRSGRAVIAAQQDLINDPSGGDKGLTGEVVLEETIARFQNEQRVSIRARSTRTPAWASCSQAQMAAIQEVVDEHQGTINRPGVGFKGFVPAVFGRLVNERFKEKVGDEAQIKVTAPVELVRNRGARPDAWETEHIEGELLDPGMAEGAGLHRGDRAERPRGLSDAGAGVLQCRLPVLPWRAQGRDRHHRLSDGGWPAGRSRRRDQHHAVSLNPRDRSPGRRLAPSATVGGQDCRWPDFRSSPDLVLLAAVLLCVLIGTNLYLGRELGRNADVLLEQGEAIDLVKTADNANVAFGDLKYWLADLAVSLLVRAEIAGGGGARAPGRASWRSSRPMLRPRSRRSAPRSTSWSTSPVRRSTPTPRTSGWSATR